MNVSASSSFAPHELLAAVVSQSGSDPLTCPAQGNSDLYGLGIRIGIYVQMLTVQLSAMNSSLRGIDDNLSSAAVIFVLSVGTTLWQLIQDKAIEAVEVAPVITLLIAQLLICRVPWWKNQIIMLMYMGEAVGLNALSIWFWFKGMDTLPRKCKDDYAFFFAKVSIWHWFRKLNKATAIMAGLGTFGGALAYIGGICFFIYKDPKAFFRGDLRDPEEARESVFSSGVTVAGIVGMIVYVELAIKWNHIEGVNSLSSTGQYMPFFIAIAQLLSTVYGLAKTSMEYLADDESLTGRVDEEEDDPPCRHFDTDSEDDASEGISMNDVSKQQQQQQQGTIILGPRP